MNRPVTPENKSEIYQDHTVCRNKQPVTVRLKDNTFPSDVYYPDAEVYHVLTAGSVVTVFGAQTLNFTGVNETQSTENTGYRIEGQIKLTIYETIPNQPKVRLQHSDLKLVAPLHCKTDSALPEQTIVALKRGIIYKKISLSKGELFVIQSNAQTPRGQNVRFRDPIDAAMYEVQHVRKQIREFKVKNSSNALVAHKDLERIT